MKNAIYLTQDKHGATQAALRQFAPADFPDHEVTVAVDYSTLNYKDALAITGKAPVVRRFPLVPGIDLAGTITASRSTEWKAGDKVIVNGWGIGETHWGGLSQQANLKEKWLTRLPQGMSTKEAMSIGTAGYTSMLCVLALQRHGIRADGGPVLVTGAGGGVGSFAVAILARLGYQVVASTGRVAQADYLRSLGADQIIEREQLSAPGKPLQKEQWQAAVDCVGSHTLVNVCAGLRIGGVVAACGLAQGMDFPATVAPFILRGISLIGIQCNVERSLRAHAWSQLAELLSAGQLEAIAHEVALADAVACATNVLNGEVLGRLIVNVNT